MDRYNNMLYNWVSPYPYMYRTGWEPVYEQGVTPQSLGQVANQFYTNGLNNAEQWAIMNNHPLLQQYLNALRTRQEYNNMRRYPDNGRYTGI